MRVNSWTLKKNSLLFIVTVFASLLIGSCNSKKEKETDPTPGLAADNTSTCFILAPNKINNTWVTTGLTTPGEGGVRPIAYVKFLSNYNALTRTVLAVGVQAYSADNVAVGGLISLGAGSACTVDLPLLVAGVVNVDLAQFPIFSPTGTLLPNFNNIRVSPTTYTEEGINYLNYTVEYVIDGASTTIANVLPCPPCRYCRPVPDDCPIIGADKKKDSIGAMKRDSVK